MKPLASRVLTGLVCGALFTPIFLLVFLGVQCPRHASHCSPIWPDTWMWLAVLGISFAAGAYEGMEVLKQALYPGQTRCVQCGHPLALSILNPLNNVDIFKKHTRCAKCGSIFDAEGNPL